MGVILPHHFSDGSGRFAVLLLRGMASLMHSIEDTAMDRIEAISYVWKGPADDDRHGVVDV